MRPGDVLDGAFRLERVAGVGGMGTVFRAVRVADRLPVAVKVMLGRDDGWLGRRFEREAEVLAELEHRHIVRFVTRGTDENGVPYLVMEWLEGEDLASRLEGGGLPFDAVLAIARGASEGLAHAHRRGVVHRDVKPSNLFLCERDPSRLKILDFGVARWGTRQLTKSGAALGTYGYMAPEQARGHRDLDARADVFALGAVLYECIAGRPAFVGDSPVAVLTKVLLEDPSALRTFRPDIPTPLEALIRAMTSKDVAMRPRDARAVREALDSISVEANDTRTSTTALALRDHLTPSEQRIVSIVLAADTDAPTDQTLAADHDQDLELKRVREVVEDFAAYAVRLANNAILVAMGGAQTAGDRARTAVRCALAVRGVLPKHRVVATTGNGDIGGGVPLGDAVDRAASKLAVSGDVPERAVVIDTLTAGLLYGGGFRVQTVGVLQIVLPGEAARSPNASSDAASSFVGRERELRLLVDTLRESHDEHVS